MYVYRIRYKNMKGVVEATHGRFKTEKAAREALAIALSGIVSHGGEWFNAELIKT